MAPIVDGLEDKYGMRLNFVRLDFDDPTDNARARALGVFGHPAIVLVRSDGSVASRLEGEVTAAKLDRVVLTLLGE
jgi:hypothetical protein